MLSGGCTPAVAGLGAIRGLPFGAGAMAWDQRFDEPILLPGGRKLITLRDAALYITNFRRPNKPPPNGKPQCKP